MYLSLCMYKLVKNRTATAWHVRVFDCSAKIQGYNVSGLVTFGQPRVGLSGFIQVFDSYNISYTRYVKNYDDQDDYVTLVPPEWPDIIQATEVPCEDCHFGPAFSNLLALHSVADYGDTLR